MTKLRTSIPERTKEMVLKEYRHRCAVCARDSPQIHHIDENATNHDPMNLLPLCPNCHLIDHHDPTRHMDVGIVRLFRQYKDPCIISPEFKPLWRRVCFLQCIDDEEIKSLYDKVEDLVDFVLVLKMGLYYSSRIADMIPDRAPSARGSLQSTATPINRDVEVAFRSLLKDVRQEVMELIIELLRYQSWTPPTGKSP